MKRAHDLLAPVVTIVSGGLTVVASVAVSLLGLASAVPVVAIVGALVTLSLGVLWQRSSAYAEGVKTMSGRFLGLVANAKAQLAEEAALARTQAEQDATRQEEEHREEWTPARSLHVYIVPSLLRYDSNGKASLDAHVHLLNMWKQPIHAAISDTKWRTTSGSNGEGGYSGADLDAPLKPGERRAVALSKIAGSVALAKEGLPLGPKSHADPETCISVAPSVTICIDRGWGKEEPICPPEEAYYVRTQRV